MTRNKIKLSIVVPCYKVEKFLPKCLDSLLSQTLDDIEIICVNDGSPDDCLKILKEYKKKHSKIVIIDKKNEGLWKGRQDGIKLAKGEFIGFVDSDDYVEKDFAKKLYDAAKQNNADIAVCGFRRIDFETGKIHSRELCRNKNNNILIRNDIGALLEINSSVWNKIYRAKILKQIPKIKNTPDVMEDLRLVELALLSTEKITFVNESLYNYLVRGESIINSIKEEALPSIYAAMREVRNLYEKSRPDDLDFIDASAFLHLGVSLMYRLRMNKKINFKKVFQQNKQILNENFPKWKNNKYIKLSYVFKNRGRNFKLWVSLQFYKMNLFNVLLFGYIFFDKLGLHIKW